MLQYHVGLYAHMRTAQVLEDADQMFATLIMRPLCSRPFAVIKHLHDVTVQGRCTVAALLSNRVPGVQQ